MHGCECAFSHRYVWAESYGITKAVYKDAFFMRNDFEGERYYFAPFHAAAADYAEFRDLLLQDSEGWPLVFIVVYEFQLPMLKRMFPGAVVEAVQDDFDYIYLQSELATLAGRKFHGQKNHYNAFCKEHPDWSYEPVTSVNLQECLALGEEWCDFRMATDPSIADEKVAIRRACAHFDELELRGGAIRYDGRLQAFSFGSKLNSTTATLHFEKVRPGVRGLYAAINKEFAAHAWQDVVYINREEDMGLEGLRTAKESLHPVMMWKKYRVRVK